MNDPMYRKPKHNPTVYLVHWPTIDVIKAGFTEVKRWRKFVQHGADLLGTFQYANAHAAFEAETAIEQFLARLTQHQKAFDTKESAVPYLGHSGGGYMECWRFNEPRTPHQIDMLKHDARMLAQAMPEFVSEALPVNHARTNNTDGLTKNLLTSSRV